MGANLLNAKYRCPVTGASRRQPSYCLSSTEKQLTRQPAFQRARDGHRPFWPIYGNPESGVICRYPHKILRSET